MIVIDNISKSYGDKYAIKDLSVKIPDNSITGLVGINGAGKSTLLRMLSGVYKVDSGSIIIDGENVYENEKVKKDIFFLPDEPYYSSNVTVDKLVQLYKTFYDFDEETYKYYLNYYKLSNKISIHNFSKGMKRQTFIALALACRPKYLFIDEVFDGLDPAARQEFKRGLIKLQETGSTIVLASHSLRELEDICDSFILLDGMKVHSSGRIEDELSELVKIQAVFNGDITEKDIPFSCLQFEKIGRVVHIVARGKKDEMFEKINSLSPIFAEEIEMNFEDLFLSEINKGGERK